MLGTSERLERVWDSGSDHSAELADILEPIASAILLGRLHGLVGGMRYEEASG
jgi:hypothetical protein